MDGTDEGRGKLDLETIASNQVVEFIPAGDANVHNSAPAEYAHQLAPQAIPMPLDPSEVILGQGPPGAPGLMQSAQLYSELNSVPIDVGSRHSEASVVCVIFDHHEELLWEGNSVGHVTSYHGPSLRKFSSFQIHQNHPVRQIDTIENAVIMLTQNCVRVSQRGGLTLYDAPLFECDLQCMLLVDQSTVLFGGHQDYSLMFDIQTGQVVSKMPNIQPDVVIMRCSEDSVCFGHTNGSVSLIDPNTFSTVRCIESHTGALSDFSISGNTLITSGFSTLSGDHLVMDTFVNVYDIRNYRLIASHQFEVEPYYVRFFPMIPNRALILSQFGQFQVVDPSGLAIPESMVLHKVEMASPEFAITACDISTTSQALAFGDTSGLLQLYGDTSAPAFNEFANPTEFPEPPSTNIYMSYDDYSIPFSMFPLPPCNKPLASDLPPSMMTNRFYDAPIIPPEVLKKIEYTDFIGYAPYPSGWVRNKIPYQVHEYSDKLAESSTSRGGVSPHDDNSNEYPFDLPDYYHKIPPPLIIETGAGIDEPAPPVSRKYPALENNSINGYANMLLYIMSTLEPLASFIKSHLCKRELCLTCEISCVIDTLKKAPSDYSFIPYNFLRVFGMLPETTALGLVISEFDDTPSAVNTYSKLIQNFNRFVLQQLHQDFQRDEESSNNSPPPTEEASPPSMSQSLSKLLGLTLELTSVCKCGNENVRESINFTTPLVYPDLFNAGVGPKSYSFEDVVDFSLTTENSTQAWCVKCHKYQLTNQKRKVVDMPYILSFNCQLDKPREISFWKVQQKLAEKPESESELQAPTAHVGMCKYGNNCARKDCRFRHEKDSDIQMNIEQFVSDVKSYPWAPSTFRPRGATQDYNLAAALMHVPAQGSRGHMIAHAILNDEYYVINDSLIQPISKEAFNGFNLNHTIPCLLFYKAQNIPESFTSREFPNPIKRDFLADDLKLVEMNQDLQKLINPLQPEENFTSTDFVSFEMNVLSNCKQETDINADGTYKTITSTENSIVVTRVVCFRGSNQKDQAQSNSVPLIDDHSQSKETVVEYINKLPTLDLHGAKHLSTFKQTLLKIKYLVDQKVILVGHNLEKKMKLFNLYVPKEQIQDIALLYKLSRQPTLPIKTLANNFGIPYSRSDLLKDCYVSIQLYKNYLKLTNEGRTMQAFRLSLQEMYNSLNKLGHPI